MGHRLANRPPKSLAVLEQMLIDSDELHRSDALANEQEPFQSVAISREAVKGMRQVQARFDSGETLREVYGEPRP